MAANHFTVDGKKINSKPDFLAQEVNNEWVNLLYYPDSFKSNGRQPIVFTEKNFINVSFKDTDFENIRFVRCTFQKCLFIGASITDCEFTDCIFLETNTSKIKITRCLIDPQSFDKNFDFKSDTNIAIDLYHSLYKNASQEHQPIHAVESLYRMKRSENYHLDSQIDRGIINKKTYYSAKINHWILDFISGYGLKTKKVLRLLLIVISLFACINYAFSQIIFDTGKGFTIVDSLYFTCVTITTLGFGDITPVTAFGKIFVTIQVLVGFIVISIFLSAVTNHALRAK